MKVRSSIKIMCEGRGGAIGDTTGHAIGSGAYRLL